MGAPISDIQYLFEIQMQQNNEKIYISKSKIVIFCLKCFEKKL
jgi:hypothetical protein